MKKKPGELTRFVAEVIAARWAERMEAGRRVRRNGDTKNKVRRHKQ